MSRRQGNIQAFFTRKNIKEPELEQSNKECEKEPELECLKTLESSSEQPNKECEKPELECLKTLESSEKTKG